MLHLAAASPAVGPDEPVVAPGIPFGTMPKPERPADDPDDDEDDWNAATDRVPNALRSTIEALGASAGVPDGPGLSWYPRSVVRGQGAPMALTNF